jgi:uracil-DNA glycosylase
MENALKIEENRPQLPFVPYQMPGAAFCGLALCGEAPGAEEVRQQRPFCGRSGKLLDEVLADLGIDRTTLMVVNVFRYQPPANKVAHFFAGARSGVPLANEYGKFGTAYVRGEYAGELVALGDVLQQAQPRAVVTLGRTPMWALTGLNTGMAATRGQWQECRLAKGLKVMPTYHPSFIIRGNWSEKETLANDIKKALALCA